MLFYTHACSAYPNATTDEVLRCDLWWESLGKFNRYRLAHLILRVDTREIWFEWKVYGYWIAIGSPKDLSVGVRRKLEPLFDVSAFVSTFQTSGSLPLEDCLKSLNCLKLTSPSDT